MNIKKVLIGIISFYIFWIGVLPFCLSKMLTHLCLVVDKKTDYQVNIVNPKIGLSIFPTVSIRLDKLVIKSKNNNFSSDIKDAYVKIRLLPLLGGNLHINAIRIDNVNASAKLSNEMHLKKDIIEKARSRRIYCDSFEINSFNFVVFQKDVKIPILYSGNNFIVQMKNRYLKVELKSRLNVDNKISTADINIYIPKNDIINSSVFDVNLSDIDISRFRKYLKDFLPKDLSDMKGFINVHADKDEFVTEFKKCAVIMQDSAKSMIFPDIFTINSKFLIKRNYIKLENIDINADNIHIFLDGRIYDYFGRSFPTFDLNARIEKSRIETIANFLPSFETEDFNVYKLKQYKYYSDVIGNISIKGRLPEPDVTGGIYLSNGILVKPIPNSKIGAIAKLKFLGRHLYFDVDVDAGNHEYVRVRGTSELYNSKYADMTVNTSENVNLRSAVDVCNPLHEILNFIIGPVPILDTDGIGNLNISVKGNRKRSDINGVMNIKNAVTCLKDMPDLKLKEADAIIKFNGDDVDFKVLKGKVNDKDFNIHGVCNVTGKFNFDVNSNNQPAGIMYASLKKSAMMESVEKMLPPIDKIDGLMDLKLKIYGDLRRIEDLKIGENAFVKGEFNLRNNAVLLYGEEVKNVSGLIKFDMSSAEANLKAFINNVPMFIKSKIKNNIADMILDIPRINPNFFIKDKKLASQNILPLISIVGKYKGSINKLEYDKADVKVVVLEPNSNGEVKIQSGNIIIQNGDLVINSLNGFIKNPQNNFGINLKVNDALSEKPLLNGDVQLKTSDVQELNNLSIYEILPTDIKTLVKSYQFNKGSLNTNCKIVNNKYYTDLDLSGINFVYLPENLPISIINGNLNLKGNTLYLKKMNLILDTMPLLVDGYVQDIFNKQKFSIYMNTKPKQEFIDKYINNKQVYPMKMKGDLVCWVKMKGVKDNFELKSKVNLEKNSSLYYYGATVGDLENGIALEADTHITSGKDIKVKEFIYNKIIESQNGKRTALNMLKSKGSISILKEDLFFNDLAVTTYKPTDARIFNIIFKKPIIKEGLFTSNLKINGKLSSPKIIGDFHIFETNIPFLDTAMKNIALVFKDKTIEITSKGDVIGNDVSVNAVMKNKTPYHIEHADIYTKNLDLNNIINKLKISQVEEHSGFENFGTVNLNSITMSNVNVKADKIELRNLKAQDVEGTISLTDDGTLNVSKFKFNIADGNLSGSYKYNIRNNDMGIKLFANSINANDIAIAMFDLKNQIYGDLTGKSELTCNGASFNNCMQTLNGNTVFTVKDGRMPKLGSLEYLLKAGNLIKGGITGLSINGVIDLITPMKTGDFSNITGNIRIEDGIARNVEIATQGKDLSIFIAGTYNFSTSVADMEVFGILARKISTMFGPVGNLSVNTLFNLIPGVDLSQNSEILNKINKIPAIELSSKSYRKFIAEIKGNINGENYVKTFQWLN